MNFTLISNNNTFCEDWYIPNNGNVRSFTPYKSTIDSKQLKYKLTDTKITLVFVHLSKSAGTSIKRSLLNNYHKNHFTLYRKTWNEFKMLSNKYGPSYWMGKVIFGTNSFGACEYAMHEHGCFYFTVLRNPIDRLISMYNYFCIDGREDRKYWLEGWNSCNYTIYEFAQKNYNMLISEIGINQDPIVHYDNYNQTTYSFNINPTLTQIDNFTDIVNKNNNSIEYQHLCKKGSLSEPFNGGVFESKLHIESSIHNLLHNIIVIPFESTDKFIKIYGLHFIIRDQISNLHRNHNEANHTLIDNNSREMIKDILWPDMFVYNSIMNQYINNHSKLLELEYRFHPNYRKIVDFIRSSIKVNISEKNHITKPVDLILSSKANHVHDGNKLKYVRSSIKVNISEKNHITKPVELILPSKANHVYDGNKLKYVRSSIKVNVSEKNHITKPVDLILPSKANHVHDGNKLKYVRSSIKVNISEKNHITKPVDLILPSKANHVHDGNKDVRTYHDKHQNDSKSSFNIITYLVIALLIFQLFRKVFAYIFGKIWFYIRQQQYF